MRQGGPVIGSELSRQGGVFADVCVVHVPGQLPSYRVAHIKVPDETNAGRNGLGIAPVWEVAALGQLWSEMSLHRAEMRRGNLICAL